MERDIARQAKKVAGKVKEVVSNAAGDRQAEAEGKIEAARGRTPDEPEARQAEEQVRREHHDID